MSALAVAPQHDWRLVAPAYGRAKPVPGSAPALQKYDASDPVTPFQHDPTQSLPFGDEDLVYAPAGGSLLLQTDVRKLFLATHKRFYLVVCELHCDTVGFPNASRADVCEAGFVVRRRVPAPRLREEFAGELGTYVAGLRVATLRAGEAAAAAERARAANVGVAVVDAPPDGAADVTAHGFFGGVEDAVEKAVEDLLGFETATTAVETSTLTIPPLFFPARPVRVKTKEELAAEQAEQELADWRAQLAEYVDARGLRLRAQGWVADPRTPGVGAWMSVAETPQHVDEQIAPLFPLVPDPANESHPAHGRTIYFGIVPTAGAELDSDGAPRFDETSLYEIRCFVRRHDPRCPRRAGTSDCKGPLFWSAPTARYRLAGHFDLHGTSQRPVAVRMPSLATLKAQAESLPLGAKLAQAGPDGRPVLGPDGRPVEDRTRRAPAPCGGGAPFRISLPKASLPRMMEPAPMLPPVPFGLGSGSFGLSIPMVTIVALFALRIFLAILSLLFPPINFLKKLAFATGNPLEDPLLMTEIANLDLVFPVLNPPELSITNCLPPLPGPPL